MIVKISQSIISRISTVYDKKNNSLYINYINFINKTKLMYERIKFIKIALLLCCYLDKLTLL